MSDQPNKITRQELYEKVWKSPLRILAEELGTTYPELVRVCDELNVPRPAPGHWQRLKLGLSIEEVPLPDANPEQPKEGLLYPKGEGKRVTSPPTTEFLKAIGAPAGTVGVGSNATNDTLDSKSKAAAVSSPLAPVPTETSGTVQYTRAQLYQAIWSTPCAKLSAKLGISDVALAKTCRRLGVPRPPRGYWARLEAGQKLPKERLPVAKEGQNEVVTFNVVDNIARRQEWAANNVLTAGKSNKPSPVELPAETVELHPIAEKHRKALEKAKPGELGFVTARGKDLFSCDISMAMAPRLVRAMHAILCELEDRDYDFEPGINEYEGLQITNDKDRVHLSWSEAKVEIAREPTAVDKRRPSWTWQLKEMKAAGALCIEVSAVGLRGKRKWTEGRGLPLEDVLAIVVEKVEATFRGFEEQREREAEWEKQRQENERLEAERRIKEEKERKDRERLKRHEDKMKEIAEIPRNNLAVAAQQWIEAQGVAAYIDYCEDQWRQTGGSELSKAQLEWLAWARAEVLKMAPSAKGYPNPEVDGALDASTVPVGGPYPAIRELDNAKAEEPGRTATPVKPQYDQAVRPPEQFPFWLLQRQR